MWHVVLSGGRVFVLAREDYSAEGDTEEDYYEGEGRGRSSRRAAQIVLSRERHPSPRGLRSLQNGATKGGNSTFSVAVAGASRVLNKTESNGETSHSEEGESELFDAVLEALSGAFRSQSDALQYASCSSASGSPNRLRIICYARALYAAATFALPEAAGEWRAMSARYGCVFFSPLVRVVGLSLTSLFLILFSSPGRVSRDECDVAVRVASAVAGPHAPARLSTVRRSRDLGRKVAWGGGDAVEIVCELVRLPRGVGSAVGADAPSVLETVKEAVLSPPTLALLLLAFLALALVPEAFPPAVVQFSDSVASVVGLKGLKAGAVPERPGGEDTPAAKIRRELARIDMPPRAEEALADALAARVAGKPLTIALVTSRGPDFLDGVAAAIGRALCGSARCVRAISPSLGSAAVKSAIAERVVWAQQRGGTLPPVFSVRSVERGKVLPNRHVDVFTTAWNDHFAHVEAESGRVELGSAIFVIGVDVSGRDLEREAAEVARLASGENMATGTMSSLDRALKRLLQSGGWPDRVCQRISQLVVV
jgi:hypothetical protein